MADENHEMTRSHKLKAFATLGGGGGGEASVIEEMWAMPSHLIIP